MEYAISLRDVVYVYGRGTPFIRVALDNVSLNIQKGGITGIIGHTGSGKSTLLQMMNGLLRPDSGEVLLFGESLEKWRKNGKNPAFSVGLVFQYPEYQLFEETVYRDVAYGPQNMKLSKEETDRRVRAALAFVGLGEELLEVSPFELSGGQKRRVAMAGIIAMEPEVLIFDEPAAGLDPKGREEIFGNIVKYQKATGKTVVIVSHSMEDIAKYAEEILVMNDGKVVLSGNSHDVFREKELLEKIGLKRPAITELMEKLKDRGMPVRTDVYTVEEAKEVLLPLLKGGSHA